MLGVSPDVITHHLSVYKEARLVAQKKRKMGEEKRNESHNEVDKLVKFGFIKKAQYTIWMANVVIIKKSNGKWRMCANYTDLNKACSKDAYHFPSIDGAASHRVLSFLDSYSLYNQI